MGTKGEPGERGKFTFLRFFIKSKLSVRINRWNQIFNDVISICYVIFFINGLISEPLYSPEICLIWNLTLSVWSDGLCWFWRLWANIVTDKFVTACDSVILHKKINDGLIWSNYRILSFLILSKKQTEIWKINSQILRPFLTLNLLLLSN